LFHCVFTITPGIAGGKHLQRDVPPQALLDGLVHHSHAAAADLAEDAKLAELFGGRGALRRGERPGRVRRVGLELLHLEQGREQLADLLGEVGAALGVLGERRPLPGPQPGDELFGQDVERVTLRG
jgi:hypothetical protein